MAGVQEEDDAPRLYGGERGLQRGPGQRRRGHALLRRLDIVRGEVVGIAILYAVAAEEDGDAVGARGLGLQLEQRGADFSAVA